MVVRQCVFEHAAVGRHYVLIRRQINHGLALPAGKRAMNPKITDPNGQLKPLFFYVAYQAHVPLLSMNDDQIQYGK